MFAAISRSIFGTTFRGILALSLVALLVFSIFSIMPLVAAPVEGCAELNGTANNNNSDWETYNFTGHFNAGDEISWELVGSSFALSRISVNGDSGYLVNTNTPASNSGSFTIPASGVYDVFLIAQDDNNPDGYSAQASCTPAASVSAINLTAQEE